MEVETRASEGGGAVGERRTFGGLLRLGWRVAAEGPHRRFDSELALSPAALCRGFFCGSEGIGSNWE